jgi:hypothetical protein
MPQVSAESVLMKYVMGSLKTSTPLHTRLAVETRLADGELLQVTVKRVEFQKLRWRPRISKMDGQDFNPV